LALSIDQPVNFFAIIGFFMLALVSWLSARSLETALKELRVINTNLDQEVIERTHALTESLDRERIEAGRNQAILNSIADGVIVFDKKWNATMANPAIKGMLDIPLELIINKNFRELIEHPRLATQSMIPSLSASELAGAKRPSPSARRRCTITARIIIKISAR
jgi:PAS domain-containing protein